MAWATNNGNSGKEPPASPGRNDREIAVNLKEQLRQTRVQLNGEKLQE